MTWKRHVDKYPINAIRNELEIDCNGRSSPDDDDDQGISPADFDVACGSGDRDATPSNAGGAEDVEKADVEETPVNGCRTGVAHDATNMDDILTACRLSLLEDVTSTSNDEETTVRNMTSGTFRSPE